ncbi:MAG: hypothetical protein AAF849_07535 [Bacteroidota bacterium]
MLPKILKRPLNKRFLKKQIKPIKRPATNLKAAKWIGILFDASSEKNIDIILNYKRKLEREGKKVNLLTYVNNRVKALEMDFPFFNKLSIDWRAVPKGEAVEEFLTRNYDLLLTISATSNLVFEYISTLSDARVKVGPVTKDYDSYDLMIEAQNGITLDRFIHYAEHYLSMIEIPSKVATGATKQLALVE